MERTTLTFRISLLLCVPPLLWAGNAVVGRLAVGMIPPVGLNFGRWLLAFALLWPLGRAAFADVSAIRERWVYLATLGLLGMGSYNMLQYLALHTSTPLNITLIAASSPVWMLGVGAAFYGIRPRPRDMLGAALSLGGVLLVIARGELRQLADLHFVPGDLLMLLAILSWALYSWLLARPPASMRAASRPAWDWAGFLLLQVAFGLAWSASAALVEAGVSAERWHWSPALAAVLLFVAVGPAILAYRCWGVGVAAVGPSVAGFFVNLTPLFTALLSALLLGEVPQWFHAAAFGMIVGGIWVSSRA